MKVSLGLEVLARYPGRSRKWGRCGLLVNQASVDSDFRPSQIVVKTILGDRLVTLFTPQHGLTSDKQDNMVESGHGRDFLSGLPFYSLYSEVREPTDAMLDGLETVIVDMQDIGTRVYTFIWTMAGVMRQCAKRGIRVVILDRPNPIGGTAVEGNILEDDSRSFVGDAPLPMRHGMTIGELALWVRGVEHLQLLLEVVTMRGWKRSLHWGDTGRKWIMTSPNMPTPETCEVYPGMVLIEGTNMSEGRGTTLPFLMIGAPYLKPLSRWLEVLKKLCDLKGLALRPTMFEPTFQKWAGSSCWGVQLIVLDSRKMRPFQIGLGMVLAAMHVAPQEFQYKEPPYEYEKIRFPLQLLLGSSSMPQRLRSISQSGLKGSMLRELEEEWQPPLKEFLRGRREVLLYR